MCVPPQTRASSFSVISGTYQLSLVFWLLIWTFPTPFAWLGLELLAKQKKLGKTHSEADSCVALSWLLVNLEVLCLLCRWVFGIYEKYHRRRLRIKHSSTEINKLPQTNSTSKHSGDVLTTGRQLKSVLSIDWIHSVFTVPRNDIGLPKPLFSPSHWWWQ